MGDLSFFKAGDRERIARGRKNSFERGWRDGGQESDGSGRGAGHGRWGGGGVCGDCSHGHIMAHGPERCGS